MSKRPAEMPAGHGNKRAKTHTFESSFRFFDLCREIRDLVYDNLHYKDQRIALLPAQELYFRTSITPTNLLLVNRQLTEELKTQVDLQRAGFEVSLECPISNVLLFAMAMRSLKFAKALDVPQQAEKGISVTSPIKKVVVSHRTHQFLALSAKYLNTIPERNGVLTAKAFMQTVNKVVVWAFFHDGIVKLRAGQTLKVMWYDKFMLQPWSPEPQSYCNDRIFENGMMPMFPHSKFGVWALTESDALKMRKHLERSFALRHKEVELIAATMDDEEGPPCQRNKGT